MLFLVWESELGYIKSNILDWYVVNVWDLSPLDNLYLTESDLNQVIMYAVDDSSDT